MRERASPEMRLKRRLERVLKKHGYYQDERPDHREWMKGTPPYLFQVRLDQNNPDGFNGFDLTITTYLRWNPGAKGLELLLKLLQEIP
jgi:hypothetical protein